MRTACIDERAYYLTKTPRDFYVRRRRVALGQGNRLRDSCDLKHADGRETSEVRLLHLALATSAASVSAKPVSRRHWAIESMHWTLDVTFREDDSRTRERTLANNLSWLRRFAITLVRRHPEKDSLRGKLLRCGYNTDFLTEVLTLKQV